MNSGTQAAKEAGKWSIWTPTDQTAGDRRKSATAAHSPAASLTTFSIPMTWRNTSHHPGLFQTVFPPLKTVNIMKLDNPHSPSWSAVIFNAIIIVLLIPIPCGA